MPESTQGQAPVLPYAERMVVAFGETAEKRLAALSVSDLDAVVMTLEHSRLVLMNELSATDDPLEAAKLRGAIRFTQDFGADLLTKAMQRQSQEAVPEKESTDD